MQHPQQISIDLNLPAILPNALCRGTPHIAAGAPAVATPAGSWTQRQLHFPLKQSEARRVSATKTAKVRCRGSSSTCCLEYSCCVLHASMCPCRQAVCVQLAEPGSRTWQRHPKQMSRWVAGHSKPSCKGQSYSTTHVGT